jgi:hypothetical protein
MTWDDWQEGNWEGFGLGCINMFGHIVVVEDGFQARRDVGGTTMCLSDVIDQ